MIWFWVIWWLCGAAALSYVMYNEWKIGGDISLGDSLLCLLWAFSGPFIFGIFAYIYFKRNGTLRTIKDFFAKPIIKGKR